MKKHHKSTSRSCKIVLQTAHGGYYISEALFFIQLMKIQWFYFLTGCYCDHKHLALMRLLDLQSQTRTFFNLIPHRHTHIYIDLWLIYSSSTKERMFFYFPKKDFVLKKRQEKGKNMQQKYLHLVAGSVLIHHVFLWVDLGFRQKGGKKRKEKIQKKITVVREKSKRKTRKSKKQEISKRLLFSFLSKGDKKRKAKANNKKAS